MGARAQPRTIQSQNCAATGRMRGVSNHAHADAGTSTSPSGVDSVGEELTSRAAVLGTATGASEALRTTMIGPLRCTDTPSPHHGRPWTRPREPVPSPVPDLISKARRTVSSASGPTTSAVGSIAPALDAPAPGRAPSARIVPGSERAWSILPRPCASEAPGSGSDHAVIAPRRSRTPRDSESASSMRSARKGAARSASSRK